MPKIPKDANEYPQSGTKIRFGLIERQCGSWQVLFGGWHGTGVHLGHRYSEDFNFFKKFFETEVKKIAP